MKVALSRDGYVSAKPGTRTRLTGDAANRLIHRERAEVDAVAVGSGTVLVDDPLLTPRVAFRERPLTRVVYDRRLRISPRARLFSTLADGPVIIVTADRSLARAQEKASALEAAGAKMLTTGAGGGIAASLEALALGGVSSLVVEGGTQLHRAFWDADLVDRVRMYVTDQVIGDGGVEWLPDAVLSSARIAARNATPIGRDVLLEAHVHGFD
jgi:diaminohydroxyphosphoribosylaminopyrimidine deaminase/5-amino-6-(5-phosphoribosylamino)uracil reductase